MSLIPRNVHPSKSVYLQLRDKGAVPVKSRAEIQIDVVGCTSSMKYYAMITYMYICKYIYVFK